MPKPRSFPRSILVGAALTVAACAGSSSADAIDREVFIATYVDLRVAALETDSVRLGDPERSEILDRHGVTGEDLVHFTEVHTSELEYMREVWNEIEVRMDREPGAD